MRIRHPEKEKGHQIVAIVGAGFAGLQAAKSLADQENVFVILIDQRNHHLFQPLLYQVATAGLNPSDIAVPIRAQFSENRNVEVHMAKVQGADLNQKLLRFQNNELEYDYLILACGARHSYFGKDEWESSAPGLKTLEQATEIRRRILLAFENAENEFDEEKRKSYLTFVIVGGGPTGVELAGAIADISRTVMVKDFKHIRPESAQVILLEAGDTILKSFDPKLSNRAVQDLQKLGVKVRTHARVELINSEGVQIAGEEFINAKTVIWAAGVQAAPFEISPSVKTDRAGRIEVESDFSVPGHPDSFVVGDMASFHVDPKNILPGLAPVAIQSGKHVARTILRSLKGKPREPFHYLDKGQMATIGKKSAIGEAGGVKFTGFIAWIAWLFIHIFYLIGFRNRVSVLLQWAWNYLFAKRGSRLITEKEWRIHPTLAD